MTEPVGSALARGTALLAAAGVDAPAREARLLLAHALGVAPSALIDRARPVETARFDDALARRAGREPFAFIAGRQGFWTFDLAVSPATLIPRADSETLVEALRDAFAGRPPPRAVLDLGTGTGALLFAALTVFPAAWGVGVDRAPAAAMLARRNAAELGMAGRACFLAGDWAAAIGRRFDAVLCNPPYVRSADIPGLMPEVARHEPAAALDGGADGLDAYRVLVAGLAGWLDPAGVAVLELGEGQSGAVAALAAAAGLGSATRNDLGGIARAMVLSRSDPEKTFGSVAAAR